MIRTFRGAFLGTLAALALAFIYGGPKALALVIILGVLEISLSFDNAVVNATVLGRMNPFWQRVFMTVGILIAVVGMRLVVPLVIVGITAKLSPIEAIRLAMEKGDPSTPGTYGFLLGQAHPAIAAFGGMFLLMIFLDFIFEEREITWLSWLENPLARIGKLDELSATVALVVLLIAAESSAQGSTVMVAGMLGLVGYFIINALGNLFATDEETTIAGAVGKSAFFLFLYLEVLDASFSFDGVIGAFAITSDPILIAIGLGIGAMYIRSLTVLLVRHRTLNEYVYLEHGAHWAIGALALVLLATLRVDVPQIVTGLIGVSFIGVALASSRMRNTASAQHLTPC